MLVAAIIVFVQVCKDNKTGGGVLSFCWHSSAPWLFTADKTGACTLWCQGLGFRVQGLGFGVSVCLYCVILSILGFLLETERRHTPLGFRVQGLGFRVQVYPFCLLLHFIVSFYLSLFICLLLLSPSKRILLGYSTTDLWGPPRLLIPRQSTLQLASQLGSQLASCLANYLSGQLPI